MGLLLSTGNASAGGIDLRGPATRLGPSRSGAPTALLPSGTRNPLDDEAVGPDGGPSVPPSAPAIVTEPLWARPLALARPESRAELPTPAPSAYRARAPPAA
ncbi:MAG TPA: hypothetical protein VFQ67_06665 [Allosphingosinicella sp.]|nr:hypothetical protein [Allosphingosinicella sp.]